MADTESKSFFKKTAGKITVALTVIGLIATLLTNVTTIQTFFQKNFAEKKGVKIVDVTVTDSTKQHDTLHNIETSTIPGKEQEIRFAGINFSKQAVDIKLRNNGDEVAFVKKLELAIKRKWVLAVDRGVSFVEIPSSKTYDIVMDSQREAPYVIPVNISHQIDPEGTERFTLSLKHSREYNTYVYLADLKIYFNEDDLSVTRENIFFAFESNSSNSYKKERVNFQNANEIKAMEGSNDETITRLVNKILQ